MYVDTLLAHSFDYPQAMYSQNIYCSHKLGPLSTVAMVGLRTREPSHTSSCYYDEEVFRLQNATTLEFHNARSMHYNSMLTVETDIISRVLDIRNKYPPCVQSHRALDAASQPHSAAPPRPTSERTSSNASGRIPQTALSTTTSSKADRALTLRFTASSKL
ncbi:uncharacterized protein M421DRAFT_359889 [Didymella exigua CBS 183.55]|uniref:Uncharacterized protein n=1 Tax=Didymella exigua CBS 183.55 TaxID=1150837 RepID=A0A6A5RUH2_9PLEO|nr:uncharacterized protein M421DRAFT_359889 [Didymella exigua CBS 183.55]KAF1930804.1 hypothetical protein M421DRAFT_359889 [Didymella exigua CBS 183.55]